MSDLAEAIRRVVRGEELPAEAMEAAISIILAGEASPVQIAAFAVSLRMRGETPSELAAAARVLRRHAKPFGTPAGTGPLVDTCGTGGDGANTFNISTGAALALSATGLRVVKHGNRAVSSRSGSADVLEALGARLELPADRLRAGLLAHRFAFLWAPAFHRAVRHAGPVRRELGLRTLFNLLGPLANPAGATHQLLGVYDGGLVEPIAEVLQRLGLEGAWVVHGHGGLDEISPTGPTRVAALEGGSIRAFTVAPSDFGFDAVDPATLAGGDAAANAALLRGVFEGRERGGPRAAVVINAAAALAMARGIADLREAAETVGAAIDDGRVAARLESWTAFTTATE